MTLYQGDNSYLSTKLLYLFEKIFMIIFVRFPGKSYFFQSIIFESLLYCNDYLQLIELNLSNL